MKVAFLDRDGVINEEVNYLHKKDNFKFTPNAISGLRRIISHGYKIIIVTNQAGIAKGFFSIEDYYELTNWYMGKLSSLGIDILDIHFCPHHPEGVIPEFSVDCECRKPKPGMLEQAGRKYQIDLDLSFIVGDKSSDVEAGLNFGLSRAYLVETGHKLSTTDYRNYRVYPDLLSIPL